MARMRKLGPEPKGRIVKFNWLQNGCNELQTGYIYQTIINRAFNIYFRDI